MTAFVVTKRRKPAAAAAAEKLATGTHPKMVIVAEGRPGVVVPYAPRETTTDGFVPAFDTVERDGRDPLLIRSGNSLKTMSMELLVVHPDYGVSMDAKLAELRSLAGSGKRMLVRLDKTAAAGMWRLTSYSQQVVDRQHGTNDPTRAVCSLVFTQVSDPRVAITKKPSGNGGGKNGGDSKKRPKFYVVKKGDTLQSIARRFYDDADVWRQIADANKIRKPKAALKVGRRLELPRVDSAELVFR